MMLQKDGIVRENERDGTSRVTKSCKGGSGGDFIRTQASLCQLEPLIRLIEANDAISVIEVVVVTLSGGARSVVCATECGGAARGGAGGWRGSGCVTCMCFGWIVV
jgi:hypothetical protein